MKTTAKLPALIVSAIFNGDMSGIEDSPEDMALYQKALDYIGDGKVVDVGDSYFSWSNDLGLGGGMDVANYTILYPGEGEDGYTADFLEGAARALWVDAWAEVMEDAGRLPPEEDLVEVADDTPAEAKELAGKLVKALTAANDRGLEQLMADAAAADDGKLDDEYARSFGFDVVMQALGTGVTWFDNHGRFPLKVPSVDNWSLREVAEGLLGDDDEA